MTNYERWRLYMDWCISPDNYIDWGWYYLISAALQRRVWAGPDHVQLFPNQYTILTGEPGLGKGLVIKQVARFLRFHKFQQFGTGKPLVKPGIQLTDEQKASLAVVEANLKIQSEQVDKMANSINEGKQVKIYEQGLAIPIAADASTYEALVMAMSNSLRRKDFEAIDPKTGVKKFDLYLHSSLCYCLEEIASLFRKKTEDLINFLLQAYDCGDYDYETIKRGRDRVRNCCLNFLGGTTPSFMRSVFTDQLLNEGFSSRTFFIFATENRKRTLFMPDLTPEQRAAEASINEHISKILELYGRVKYEDEAWEWLNAWWAKADTNRPNVNPKLNAYYARKNLHLQKLAIAMHFGESTDMLIKLPTFIRAEKVLAEEERRMHYCLGFDQKNPLSDVCRQVHEFLAREAKLEKKYGFKDLLARFWEQLPVHEKPDQAMSTALEMLVMSGKIFRKAEPHPITKDNQLLYFCIKDSNEQAI